MVQPLNKEEKIVALKEGKKIQAIKMYRERTRSGLKEAKEEVELYLDNPETYNKTHEDEQHKTKLMKDFIVYVVQEADILQNINARLLCKKEKTRSDVVNMIENRTIFANQVKIAFEKFLKEYI